jgi:tellurite methyltransferase
MGVALVVWRRDSTPRPLCFAAMGTPRRVRSDEAAQLVSTGRVRVLDVRSPQEYAQLGHIPAARLLPVELTACAPAVLERDRPWLVCCEHGVRSAFAADLLARAGFEGVLDLADGMAAWDGPREHGPGRIDGPNSWLLECASLLPRDGPALDLACGRGRHALLLASAGYEVTAIDREASALDELRRVAARLELPVVTQQLDLEAGEVELGSGRFALILVVHYLHRPLFPALVRALRPGGLLVYETFTEQQALRGQPKNPDFLLRAGELPRLVAPLRVVRAREGEFDERDVSALAALRPPA